MTYDPERYWPERYRRQGPTYVAAGGRPESFDAQLRGLAPILRGAVTGHRVLDFGCGPGRFRPVLEEGGREYVGVDLIPGLGTVELGESLPRGFDCAVAVMVLQHIVDPVAYAHWARELHACLNPGGRLVVVDHKPIANPDSHMAPRGMIGLQAAARWSAAGRLGEHDGHWIGWFAR